MFTVVCSLKPHTYASLGRIPPKTIKTAVYACKGKPKTRMNSIPLKPHTYGLLQRLLTPKGMGVAGGALIVGAGGVGYLHGKKTGRRKGYLQAKRDLGPQVSRAIKTAYEEGKAGGSPWEVKVKMNSIPLKPHTYSLFWKKPKAAEDLTVDDLVREVDSGKVLSDPKTTMLGSLAYRVPGLKKLVTARYPGDKVISRDDFKKIRDPRARNFVKSSWRIAQAPEGYDDYWKPRRTKNLSQQEKAYGLASNLRKQWGALSSGKKAAVVAGGAAAGAAGVAGGGYVTGRVKGRKVGQERVQWDMQNPTAMHKPPKELTASRSRWPGFQSGQKRGLSLGGQTAFGSASSEDRKEWLKRAAVLQVGRRMQQEGRQVALNARYWGPSGQRYNP